MVNYDTGMIRQHDMHTVDGIRYYSDQALPPLQLFVDSTSIILHYLSLAYDETL